jgi:hypothetical protein
MKRSTSLMLALGIGSIAYGQSSSPDFSGVYYPLAPFGRGGLGGPGRGAPPKGAPKGPPSRPTQSAPLADGSQGRAPDAPSLTPEYMAKWEVIRKSRIAGSAEYDNTLKCLPPGMPAMMNMAYGMEVMQTKDKVTFFSELNDALRRVYLDGRKPSAKVLDDPTYAGYSTGHWEGDTLVVDTIGFNDKTWLDSTGKPHSEALHVVERYRRPNLNRLEIAYMLEDTQAFSRPYTFTRTFTRVTDRDLREYFCAMETFVGK